MCNFLDVGGIRQIRYVSAPFEIASSTKSLTFAVFTVRPSPFTIVFHLSKNAYQILYILFVRPTLSLTLPSPIICLPPSSTLSLSPYFYLSRLPLNLHFCKSQSTVSKTLSTSTLITSPCFLDLVGVVGDPEKIDSGNSEHVLYYLLELNYLQLSQFSCKVVQQRATQDQIAYFGQTPSQLLTVPHLRKKPLADVIVEKVERSDIPNIDKKNRLVVVKGKISRKDLRERIPWPNSEQRPTILHRD
uniref:Uncharacterized protein n=1 Tax=Cucumis melo TaxID=3656 RepID=A0A9I9EEF9_CUCME